MADNPPTPRAEAPRDGVRWPGRRGPVRRFLEVRGWVGGHTHPHEHVRLRAGDDTPLVGTLLDGPTDRTTGLVLLHGFAAHRRKPAYAALADALAAHAHVLAVDLRGHGHSGGVSTLGDREALDVDAAVGWLRARGHEQVVVVGASMGATSLLHAVAQGVAADAAVAISAPATLEEEPASEAMQRLQRVWASPAGRAGMRWGIGVRVVPPSRWDHPGHPSEFVRRADLPLLVVHGADDAYFPVADAELLVERAPRATLWLEPDGFGHAEDGFSPALADRLGRAIPAALADGRFPDRGQVSA